MKTLGDPSPSTSFFVSMGQELHGSSRLGLPQFNASKLQTSKNKKPSDGYPPVGLKINSNFLEDSERQASLFLGCVAEN